MFIYPTFHTLNMTQKIVQKISQEEETKIFTQKERTALAETAWEKVSKHVKCTVSVSKYGIIHVIIQKKDFAKNMFFTPLGYSVMHISTMGTFESDTIEIVMHKN